MGLWDDLQKIIMPWRDKPEWKRKQKRAEEAKRAAEKPTPAEKEKIVEDDKSPPTQEPFATVPTATKPKTEMMGVCYMGDNTDAQASNVRLYYPKFNRKWRKLPKPSGRTVE
jgi:hypothetical protein